MSCVGVCGEPLDPSILNAQHEYIKTKYNCISDGGVGKACGITAHRHRRGAYISRSVRCPVTGSGNRGVAVG